MSVAINGRDVTALLKSEAKRRPEIQAMIDNIGQMSYSDIDRAKVPMKWYREALRKLKRAEDGRIALQHTLKAMANNVVDSSVADIEGTIRRWEGGAEFITVDRNGGLEVRTGALLFFPKEGGVWIDTAFSQHIDPKLMNTSFVAAGTKSSYRTAISNKLQRDHPGMLSSTSVADDSIVSSNPLFTIHRL